MPRRKRIKDENPTPLVPATTPEGREQQLIARAMDLAERHLIDGTASSAEIVHFLKRGSIKEKLEETKLKRESDRLEAQTKSIQSMEDTKVLMEQAIRAMRSYQGDEDSFDEGEEDVA